MLTIRTVFRNHVCRQQLRVSLQDHGKISPRRQLCANSCSQEARTEVGTGTSQSSAAVVGPSSEPGDRTLSRRKTRRRPADQSIFAKYALPHQFEETTQEELERQLADSKVYDQDGIIGLNKPAGVPVADTGQDLHSIVKILPQLAESIGKPSAEVAKATDRDSSGLVLLGENKQVTQALHDAFIKAHRSNQLIRKYWALTIGVPTPEEGTIDFPLSPEKIGDQTLMVPSRHPSKGNFERKEAVRCRTDYRVLSANRQLNCCLLELKPLKLKKHQFQVHLGDKLCCILGDRIYSGRVREILGVPVLVEPQHAAVGTQTLPESVREVLGLRTWHLSRLPLFLHWYQVSLPKWHRGQSTTITAAPPGYFTEALERLGLSGQPVQGV